MRWGEETAIWSCPAGAVTSSFRAESVALRSALLALGERLRGAAATGRVRVCADSPSALTALSFGPAAQRHHICVKVWEALEDCAAPGRTFDFVWVPGHAGIDGNEEADAAAATWTRRRSRSTSLLPRLRSDGGPR